MIITAGEIFPGNTLYNRGTMVYVRKYDTSTDKWIIDYQASPTDFVEEMLVTQAELLVLINQ